MDIKRIILLLFIALPLFGQTNKLIREQDLADSLLLYVEYSDSLTRFATPNQLTDSLNVVRDTLSTHRTELNTLNGFVNQSVKSGSSPTLTGTNFTGIPISGVTALQDSLDDKLNRGEATFGTVTNITIGNGLTGTSPITSTGTITLGTPTTLSTSTTNLVSATTHTHALSLGTMADVDSTTYTGSSSIITTGTNVTTLVDHSGVTLTAGDGLGGGGDITANRSFAVLLDYDGGIETTDDSLNIKLDGSTLTLGSSGIKVSDATLSAKVNVADSNTIASGYYVAPNWLENSFDGNDGIVTTGALNSGSITSGFGSINVGSSAITTTGAGSLGSLSVTGVTTLNNKTTIFKGNGTGFNLSYDNATNSNTGLFMWTRGSSNAQFGGGVEQTGDNIYTARSTSASIMEMTGGAISFYNNTGLTAGNTYTRTNTVNIASDGTLNALFDLSVTGIIGNTAQQAPTLGVGVTTLALTTNVITITGDGGGNTIATFTGASVGTYTFIFVDALVTITDTDAHTANTIDLAGTATDLTSADDLVLQVVYDGTSFYEISRSAN